MKSSLRKTIVILATSIAFTSIAQAEPHHKKEGHHKPAHVMHCLKKLDLSDKQRTMIKDIKMQYRKSDTQDERQTMRESIQALIKAEQLDKAELEKLADKGTEKMKSHFMQRVEMQHQIRQVLTSEQKQKFDDCQQKRPHQRQKH